MKNTLSDEQENIISLCTVTPCHKEFLLKVFAESRWDLALISGVSEEQRAGIILEQYSIEQQQMAQMYPEASLNIVMLNNRPIGRLYIHYGERADRILEMGLLENHRKMGAGKKVMTIVIENALEKGKTVSLQVAWFNQGAYGFFEKLGFKAIRNNGIFYEMHYMP